MLQKTLLGAIRFATGKTLNCQKTCKGVHDSSFGKGFCNLLSNGKYPLESGNFPISYNQVKL